MKILVDFETIWNLEGLTLNQMHALEHCIYDGTIPHQIWLDYQAEDKCYLETFSGHKEYFYSIPLESFIEIIIEQAKRDRLFFHLSQQKQEEIVQTVKEADVKTSSLRSDTRLFYANRLENLFKLEYNIICKNQLKKIGYSTWILIDSLKETYTILEAPYWLDDILFDLLTKKAIKQKPLTEETTKQKEDTTMMPNTTFEFGPCTENIAISPYGLAIKTKNGKYLTYDAANGKTVDVTGFTFNFNNLIYKVPTAVKDLREGTIVLHQGRPMFITKVDKTIEAIDIAASEAKTILPITNMFGFDYVTTVVSFMNFGATPTADNPFGNLMPFMMAQMCFNDTKDSNMEDMSKMMMFCAMTGQQSPFASFMNPSGK